jgi:pimeloyl-ACP methyl ester carboxylesterase
MSFVKLIQGSPESHLTPLFLIHAVSGLANPYSRLGPLTQLSDLFSLDDQRLVYGISSPLYTARNAAAFKSPTSLAAMARLYVKAVRKKQPYGPYLLGGWSMGGMLAVKMADILIREHGEQVLRVLVIDGANPVCLPAMSEEERIVMGDEILARNLGFAVSGTITNKASLGAWNSPPSDSASSSGTETRPPLLPRQLALGGELETFLLKIRAHIALGLDLMSTVDSETWLSTHLPTKMVLIKCVREEYLQDGQFGTKGEGVRALMAQDAMGWDKGRFGGFETVMLRRGTHDTCFDEEFVGDVTEVLVSALVDVE